MQVKCNWYRMEAIALTVKRSNSKTPLPEAVSRLLRKTCSPNPTTNRENAQQVAFPPIKLAKQSY